MLKRIYARAIAFVASLKGDAGAYVERHILWFAAGAMVALVVLAATVSR